VNSREKALISERQCRDSPNPAAANDGGGDADPRRVPCPVGGGSVGCAVNPSPRGRRCSESSTQWARNGGKETSSSSMTYQLVDDDLPAGRRRLCPGLPAAAIRDGEMGGRERRSRRELTWRGGNGINIGVFWR
jgi:hypothetical protein